MQKILITGGCGYIGSHTIVDLIEHGFSVVSVDNLMNSDEVVLEQIKSTTGQAVKNYQVDLTNLDALREVFRAENFDGIIHFAALKAVGESVEKPLEYYDNNVIGLINLLKCQREFGVQHHIFSSSCSVYGIAEKLPVTEESPIQEAESPYARTKQINEYILQDYSVAYPDFRFTILRYFNPAGAHEAGHMGESPTSPALNLVPVITETAAGKRDKVIVFGDDYPTRDGSCIRDYIHIQDLANAHTLALQSSLDSNDEDEPVRIFNLGTGEGVTVLEAIKAFESTTGKKLPYHIGPRRPGDVIEIYANKSKAEKELAWQTKFNINDIMKSAWEWEKKKG